MAGTLQFEMRLTGLDGALDMLRQLPAEVVSKNGGVVRTSLRKGAVVILKQALANLDTVTSNATSEGRRLSTGFLAKNVIVTRGKAILGANGERFLVRVRRKTYPSGTAPRRTTLQTAQLLEYGSEKQPAEPWIRPAATSRARESIETIERETAKGIARIVRKLARQGSPQTVR
jgi:HK97 gp10 family phage protein